MSRMFLPARASSFKTRVLWGICAFLLGGIPLGVAAEPAQPIPTVQQIRKLGPDKAGRNRAVRLQGTVTAVSGWKNSFFLQDASAGISIDRDFANPEVQPGERVELEGVTAAGKFAPIVKAGQVRVIGTSSFPAPQVADAEALTTGSLDSQWATVHGFVRTAIVTKLWEHEVLSLEMDLGEGTVITANIREFTGTTWQRLPGSMIAVRGVCGTVFNDRRQFVRARLFVNSLKDITVLRAGPTDLFDREPTSITSLSRFSSGISRFEPVKIRGVLTSLQAPDKAYVQYGTEGVLVHTGMPVELTRGSSIEVVGFARQGDYAPSLEGAVLHRIAGEAKLPQPIAVDPKKVIADVDGFTTAPYDGVLIRIKGTLTQIIPTAEDQLILFLQDDNTFFSALLPKAAAGQGLPEVGSTLVVEGVCFTRVNSAHDPIGFRVLLQSTADIAVVHGASWWTARHAKEVVLGMAFAVLLMAALLFFYRRESVLRELSVSDPLTGVYNRRGFVLLAEQQWRQALRHRESMELFYIDVDDFKQINDTLGHKQGDVALQVVATLLRDCFRGSDIIGRLGGDEFAIVAPKAGPQASLKARLEHLVEQHNKVAGHAFYLALSIGVLQCDPALSELSIEDLLTRADVLMYGDKTKRKAGRCANVQAVRVQRA